MDDSLDIFSPPSFYHANANRRRLLGAYYTPKDLAEVLTRWALTPDPGTVLDPSFGGCVFLEAAAEFLAKGGIDNPGKLIFGVDVDPSCLKFFRSNNYLNHQNCIIRDFLELLPVDIPGAPFQAVVGNPPYVRRHWLKRATFEAARISTAKSGISLPRTASSWAYFLIHAMNFVAVDGRLAMLVPEAILQTDYSSTVRKVLATHFNHVDLVYIRDRVFVDTNEPVVVVAASGYGTSGSLRVEAVECVRELDRVLNDSVRKIPKPRTTTSNARLVNSKVIEILNELAQQECVKKLADVATVEIGFVTGSNNHFIRNRQELEHLQVPRTGWLPVIPRTRWLAGLDFTEEDIQEYIDKDFRCYLVFPEPCQEQHQGFKNWIEEGIRSEVHNRVKCSVRAPWFRVKLSPVPNAFATCTRSGSPLLVLNRTSYRCSNALHAVRWHSNGGFMPEAASVSFLTSAVSVWAELHGRRYGGGVLKMEPSTLKRVPLPIVRAAGTNFEELNELMRQGREAEARKLADNLVLYDGLGLSKRDIQLMQQAGDELLAQRRPTRTESVKNV